MKVNLYDMFGPSLASGRAEPKDKTRYYDLG